MASTFIKLPLDNGGGGPPAGVDSFNGRTGVVVSQAGDYGASNISNVPAGAIAATDVQAAINELDAEKQALITGAASTITTSNLTADRALQSNASGKVAVSAVTATELAHVSGVTSALQTQLNNKQPLDATLTALAAYNSNGILTQSAPDTFVARTITGTASEITVTNGDGISGNPTISLPNTAVTPGFYTNPLMTVDAKGRITGIANGVSGGYDIDTEYEIMEDFDGPTATLLNSPLQVLNQGTGALVVMNQTFGVDSTQNAIGVAQFQSGTLVNSRAYYSGGSNAFENTGSWTHYFKGRFAVDSFGTAIDAYGIRFGYGDSNTSIFATDEVAFRFQANGVNTNWECVTRAGGVGTALLSSATVTIGLFQTFEIYLNSAQAQYYIDGVLVATINTNLPGLNQRFGPEGIIIKTIATTGVEINMYIDYVYYLATRTGER